MILCVPYYYDYDVMISLNVGLWSEEVLILRLMGMIKIEQGVTTGEHIQDKDHLNINLYHNQRHNVITSYSHFMFDSAYQINIKNNYHWSHPNHSSAMIIGSPITPNNQLNKIRDHKYIFFHVIYTISSYHHIYQHGLLHVH